MPQLESYGIDGNDFFESPYEKVVEIPFNRVLFAGKFTDADPTKPELAREVRSLSQLFEHYKPVVNVPFRNAAGKTVSESFRFYSIDDFEMRAMESQSNYITALEMKRMQQQKMVRQLRSNKQLQQVINEPEQRQALLDQLLSMAKKMKR
jgi:predicted component of type VI protein secretion system